MGDVLKIMNNEQGDNWENNRVQTGQLEYLEFQEDRWDHEMSSWC